jgi:hypothetical protein
MEKRNLPNTTLILILGIASIVTCCCYGIIGLTTAIIALVLAKKDLKLYLEEPEIYSNYQNLKIGKALAIIGIILSTIYLLFTIYMYSFLGQEGIKKLQENLTEKIKNQ